MSEIKDGAPGAFPPVLVGTPSEEFENAIRKFGVVNACEWFGHAPDSDFTAETIKVLAERGMEQ